MSDGTPLELLKQARVHNLLKLWAAAKRQLTSEEIAEIREVYPDFQPESPAGGEQPALPTAPLPMETEITAEQAARWKAVYGYGRRTFFRYRNTGRANLDPCPLDEPAKMPAWWSRNMKQSVPEGIIRAAQQAAAEAPPPAAGSEAAPHTLGAEQNESTDGFDLANAELGEGEEVQLARQTLSAFATKLREATKAGKNDDISYWHSKVKDAQKTLKETRAEDREERKSRGLLMSRAEAELQIFEVLKMLAATREIMGKQIVSALRKRFPDLSEELITALLECVEHTRAREDDLFRDLSVMKSPGDVFRLAA